MEYGGKPENVRWYIIGRLQILAEDAEHSRGFPKHIARALGRVMDRDRGGYQEFNFNGEEFRVCLDSKGHVTRAE